MTTPPRGFLPRQAPVEDEPMSVPVLLGLHTMVPPLFRIHIAAILWFLVGGFAATWFWLDELQRFQLSTAMIPAAVLGGGAAAILAFLVGAYWNSVESDQDQRGLPLVLLLAAAAVMVLLPVAVFLTNDLYFQEAFALMIPLSVGLFLALRRSAIGVTIVSTVFVAGGAIHRETIEEIPALLFLTMALVAANELLLSLRRFEETLESVREPRRDHTGYPAVEAVVRSYTIRFTVTLIAATFATLVIMVPYTDRDAWYPPSLAHNLEFQTPLVLPFFLAIFVAGCMAARRLIQSSGLGLRALLGGLPDAVARARRPRPRSGQGPGHRSEPPAAQERKAPAPAKERSDPAPVSATTV